MSKIYEDLGQNKIPPKIKDMHMKASGNVSMIRNVKLTMT